MRRCPWASGTAPSRWPAGRSARARALQRRWCRPREPPPPCRRACCTPSRGPSREAGTSLETVASEAPGRRGLSGSAGIARGGEHLAVEMSGVERPPGLGAGEPDLARAEQQGIDLVEVPLVPLEDVVECR